MQHYYITLQYAYTTIVTYVWMVSAFVCVCEFVVCMCLCVYVGVVHIGVHGYMHYHTHNHLIVILPDKAMLPATLQCTDNDLAYLERMANVKLYKELTVSVKLLLEWANEVSL